MRLRIVSVSGMILALAAGGTGCIERPSDDLSNQSADRTRAADVLLPAAPAVRYVSGARFDDLVELVGADVAGDALVPGARVNMTLYWRVLENVTSDWKIFVHANEPGTPAPKVNADHWPAQDRLRTNAWRRGDLVRDTFTFSVPRDATGRLEVWTGFYAGNDRLPVTSGGRGGGDGQNRVRVATFTLH